MKRKFINSFFLGFLVCSVSSLAPDMSEAVSLVLDNPAGFNLPISASGFLADHIFTARAKVTNDLTSPISVTAFRYRYREVDNDGRDPNPNTGDGADRNDDFGNLNGASVQLSRTIGAGTTGSVTAVFTIKAAKLNGLCDSIFAGPIRPSTSCIDNVFTGSPPPLVSLAGSIF